MFYRKTLFSYIYILTLNNLKKKQLLYQNSPIFSYE